MLKKALWVMIPFLLIFLLGLFLFLRPQYRVPIVEVVDTFTQQEKTGQRSPHRHTVAYATVKVDLDGEKHEVTVHDNTWKPLKAGDSVVVTRGCLEESLNTGQETPTGRWRALPSWGRCSCWCSGL